MYLLLLVVDSLDLVLGERLARLRYNFYHIVDLNRLPGGLLN